MDKKTKTKCNTGNWGQNYSLGFRMLTINPWTATTQVKFSLDVFFSFKYCHITTITIPHNLHYYIPGKDSSNSPRKTVKWGRICFYYLWTFPFYLWTKLGSLLPSVNLSGAHVSFIYTHTVQIKVKYVYQSLDATFAGMGTSFISQNVALGKHQDLILGGPSATFSFFFFRKAKKLFDKLVVTLEIHVNFTKTMYHVRQEKY